MPHIKSISCPSCGSGSIVKYYDYYKCDYCANTFFETPVAKNNQAKNLVNSQQNVPKSSLNMTVFWIAFIIVFLSGILVFFSLFH